MERAYNERDKTESGSYAQEYLNYFLEEEPSPGIAYEYRLVQQLLPTVTTDEVSTFVRTTLLGDDSRVLLATSPQKAGVSVPSEADLQAALASADQGRGHAVERDDGHARARRKQAGAGGDHLAPGGSRGRRHDRAICERRRGVAEADRLQERSGALRHGSAWRRVAGGLPGSARGAALDLLRRPVGRRRPEGARPAEDARRQARVRLAVRRPVGRTAFPAARRRPSSKRRCSCSIWISRRRTTIRRRSRC